MAEIIRIEDLMERPGRSIWKAIFPRFAGWTIYRTNWWSCNMPLDRARGAETVCPGAAA